MIDLFDQIKRILKRLLPKAWWPIEYLTQIALRESSGLVIGGPFKGMRYVNEAIGSVHIPKLLGIYEREIGEIVEMIASGQFATIVVIGAAEGYYAVGMSMRTQTNVIAFESSELGQSLIRQLAGRNGIDNVLQIKGNCSVTTLNEVLPQLNTAVICDIEGGELELLDPILVPHLQSAYILVEVHDFIHENVGDILRSRFEATHVTRTIYTQSRTVNDYPFATAYSRVLPRYYLEAIVSEMRPPGMYWLWMTPRGEAKAVRN